MFLKLLWFYDSNFKNIVNPVTELQSPRNQRNIPSCGMYIRTTVTWFQSFQPSFLLLQPNGLFMVSPKWHKLFSLWVFAHIYFMLMPIPGNLHPSEFDFILQIPGQVPLPKLDCKSSRRKESLPSSGFSKHFLPFGP